MNLDAERRASLDDALLDKLRGRDGKPYTHIIAKIRALWGTKTCDQYLNSLLIDDRGKREGFPPEVSTAIMSLLMANEIFMRRTTGKREIDTLSGHDWANATGRWEIRKSNESKPKPEPDETDTRD
jgi:hypothetical protein